MYSKVYWITCHADHGDELLDHYDAVVAPAIKESAHHIGHQMIVTGGDQWILVADYESASAAEAAVPMVRDLVSPMNQKFGMKLNVMGEGEVVRRIS